MSAETLAVYSTWYPGVEKFVPAWYASVAAQSDRGFDLWVGVDALDAERLMERLNLPEGPAIHVFPPVAGRTPAAVRGAAIESLLDRYPAIVFVDSDDVLEPSRIAAARRGLDASDVAACALRIIDEGGRDVGAVFDVPPETDWEEFLPRYNAFGLSNSAYRSAVLRRCLPIPAESVLIDWLLVTRAWALGAALAFDHAPRMGYRQYAANVARVLPPLSAADVLAGTERVLGHYRLLREGGGLAGRAAAILGAAESRAAGFHESIRSRPDRLARYVAAINEVRPTYVWWWYVAHPQLEEIWKN